MSNPNKRRGSAWEKDLVDYFRSHDAVSERLALAGAEDDGDLFVAFGAKVAIVEAKNRKQLDLAGWVREAEAEAQNYAKHRGIEVPPWAVAVKRRNHTVGAGYIVLTVDEWIRQTSR